MGIMVCIMVYWGWKRKKTSKIGHQQHDLLLLQYRSITSGTNSMDMLPITINNSTAVLDMSRETTCDQL